MSDRKDQIKKENIRDDISDISEASSEYHEIEPYIKTPSPPIPIRDTTITPVESVEISSTPSSVSSRLGHLEEQRKLHSESRKNQAARNSITTLINQTRKQEASKSDKMISNSPDDGNSDSDHEQEEVEKVLDSELVSDDEISARDMESLVKAAYYDLLVVLPLMFLPTVLVYLFVSGPFDNVFIMKDPQYITKVSEFFRYNIFASIAYGLFVIFDVLSLVIPEGILVFTPTEKDNKATKFIREQLHLIINVRNNIALSTWLLALVPLAAWILYNSMFTTPLALLNKIFESKVEKKVAEASSSAVAVKLLAEGQNMMMQRNIEVTLVLLAIFSTVLAVEKYLMQIIALRFHRSAFSTRISDSNHQFSYLLKLYEAVKYGKPRVISSTSSVNLLDIDSSIDLSYDKGLHLTSVHRAKSVAKLIFRTILPANGERDYVVVEDFEKWTNKPKETFACLDLDESGKVHSAELEEAVVEIFNTRDNLCRGLKSNGRIVKKLDGLFLIVALCIGGVLASPIFDVGAIKLLMSLGVLSTGFGFLFHSTAKSCFESLLFVFIQHPFDVGDRVVIDDETFVVEDIEIFTTRMVRWDGVTVYIANSSLCSKAIQNIRRSDDQLESLALKIKGDTPTESLLTFRQELHKELIKNTGNFTGEVDLANLDKLPSNNEALSFIVLAQVRGNFQNPAKRNVRKTELLAIVERALQASSITKA